MFIDEIDVLDRRVIGMGTAIEGVGMKSGTEFTTGAATTGGANSRAGRGNGGGDGGGKGGRGGDVSPLARPTGLTGVIGDMGDMGVVGEMGGGSRAYSCGGWGW